jgi:lipoprotein NlpI
MRTRTDKQIIEDSARMFSLLLVAAVSIPAADESFEQLVAKAQAALKKGDNKRALDLADKAVTLDPKAARGYLFRGSVHETLEQHKEAIADFDKCIELDPKTADAYDHRGSEYFKLGKIDKSLADFDRFLELNPKARPAHWKRGISLYYAGKFDDGAKQFKAGDQVFADDVENAVWHYLCNVHVVGADKASDAILKIGKDKRVPLMVVYDLFKGKAKPEDVLKAANDGKPKAEELKERLFYAHLYLGLYYESAGDKKKTLEHMTKAAEEYKLGGYMWDVARVHLERLRKK